MPEATQRWDSGLLVAAAVVSVLSFWGRTGEVAEPPPAPVASVGEERRLAKVRKVVEASFPGAMQGRELATKVLGIARELGACQGNSIFGQSICSDEINGDAGHLPALLAAHFGHAFSLGGIGGAPFVGKTGFAAFSHHVPDSGHVVLAFGPHIGFTAEGEPGKFLRAGQKAVSTACGALVAAYGQNMHGCCVAADPQDAQQSWLRSRLQAVDEIARATSPMVELVLQAYKAVEAELFDIVNTDFGSGKLILIGGVQINMPYPMEGFWAPLHFSVRSARQEPVDLLPLLN